MKVLFETDNVILRQSVDNKLNYQLKGLTAHKLLLKYGNKWDSKKHLEILFDVDINSYYKLKQYITQNSRLYDPKNDVCEFGPSKDKYFRW